jgi:sugar O-acyltransferase (sialic acid O-acetyltransferase NeuD family)
MTDKVAIIGGGGHARVVASILRAKGVDIHGFFDDSYSGSLEIIQGAPLLGRFDDIVNFSDAFQAVYLALGSNLIRKNYYDFLSEHDFLLPSFFHPTAIIESDVSIDCATAVCLGGIVGAEVKIGKGCIINTGCSVDHESIIGNFVHLAPKVAVAGRTSIGSYTFVGINTAIADKLTIGKNVTIGAGSVILTDVPDGAKVFGVHR